jgi:hypothetical protein
MKAHDAILILLIALSVLPIWLNTYLPFQDYPAHLFRVHIEKKLLEGDPFYSEYFRFNYLLPPYLTLDLFLLLLSLAFPLDVAGRILISILLVLFPLSFRFARKRLGLHPIVPFLSLLLEYNYFVQMGFVNTCLSIAVLVVFFSIWHSAPERKYAFLAGVLLLYFTHIFTLPIFLLGVGLTAVLEKRKLTYEKIYFVVVGLLPLAFLAPLLLRRCSFHVHYFNIRVILRLFFETLGGLPMLSVVNAILLVLLLPIAYKAGKHRSFLAVALLFFLLSLAAPFGISCTGYLPFAFFLISFLQNRFVIAGQVFLLMSLPYGAKYRRSLIALVSVAVLACLFSVEQNIRSYQAPMKARVEDYLEIGRHSVGILAVHEQHRPGSYADPFVHLWQLPAIRKDFLLNNIAVYGSGFPIRFRTGKMKDLYARNFYDYDVFAGEDVPADRLRELEENPRLERLPTRRIILFRIEKNPTGTGRP